MEKVSIIIPVYNVENELAVCLDSVLNQTYKNIEVIIVDDGSKDGSAQIIDRYVDKDSRIFVITQINQGVSVARNTGMKASSGDFIVFVDSDDWIESNYIEKMIERMQETKADIVECGYSQRKNINDVNFSNYPRKYDVITGTEKILWKHLEGEISVLVWNKLYRSSLIKEVMFEEGVEYEDVLWTCTVLQRVSCIAAVKEQLYNWRERKGSISRRQFDEKRFAALERFDTRIIILENMFGGAKRLARAHIIVECYLELQGANNTYDKELMLKARKHSYEYYQKWKLSLIDFIKLQTLKEKVKYIYYCIYYMKAMVQNVRRCRKIET